MSNEKREEIKAVLSLVYNALEEKGYNPVDQLLGYLLSNDFTYITPNRGARTQIVKFDRDDILEELLRSYFNKFNK
jgi:uncharacterized protein (UPF0297 family)